MFSHILIAHDLSLESDIALQRAAQLANQHHARLTLLHVVEGHPDAKALAELQAAAEKVLGERLATYSHCRADVVLRSGQARPPWRSPAISVRTCWWSAATTRAARNCSAVPI